MLSLFLNTVFFTCALALSSVFWSTVKGWARALVIPNTSCAFIRELKVRWQFVSYFQKNIASVDIIEHLSRLVYIFCVAWLWVSFHLCRVRAEQQTHNHRYFARTVEVMRKDTDARWQQVLFAWMCVIRAVPSCLGNLLLKPELESELVFSIDL